MGKTKNQKIFRMFSSPLWSDPSLYKICFGGKGEVVWLLISYEDGFSVRVNISPNRFKYPNPEVPRSLLESGQKHWPRINFRHSGKPSNLGERGKTKRNLLKSFLSKKPPGGDFTLAILWMFVSLPMIILGASAAVVVVLALLYLGYLIWVELKSSKAEKPLYGDTHQGNLEKLSKPGAQIKLLPWSPEK